MPLPTPTFRTPYSPSTTNGGGRGPVPPEPQGGGGGGGRGDGDRSPNQSERLRRFRLGLFFMLVSITMLFVSFTTLYIARKTAGRFDPVTGMFQTDWVPPKLPTRIFLIDTVILLLSTFTIEKARRTAAFEAAVIPASFIPGIAPIRETSGRWTQLSAVLGVVFLLGQWTAWRSMFAHGISMSTGPASSFVFLLTGAHAVHLVGGILALLWASMTHVLHRPFDSRRVTLEVTAIFWHFMTAVWIYILVLLEFVR